MRTITRRFDWIVLLLLPAALAHVIVVDASSKSNLPPPSPLSTSTNDAHVAMNSSSMNDNSNNSTTMTSERIRPSVTKRDKTKASTENSESEVIARKKKKGSSSTSTHRSGSGSRPLSTPGGTSTSLRRIKREYKDAVEMGIAYDWVNQRLIQRKTKARQENKTKTKMDKHAIICLGPITTNLRQWHFSFRGAGEGLYSKGIYHGQILLPKNYPLSPPSVQMWTPSGRFVPQMDICLSASNYHPESWTPRWSIQGIVNALRLHMLSGPNEIGGMQSTPDETMEYARLSLEWKKTWVTSGTKTKKIRITVDHRRLLNEGVLSDATVLEDTEATEENGVPSTTREDTILDSVSDLDLNQDVAMKPNADSRDGSVNSKVDKDNSRIRFSARFGFSNETVASIFQLAILYMVVFVFLNR